MKSVKFIKAHLILALFLMISSGIYAGKKDSLTILITNPNGTGAELTVETTRGKNWSYPVIAIWAEDMEGNYLGTLYVSKAIATSVYGYGKADHGAWMPGVIRRPATLPYWAHKRGVKAEDGYYLPSANSPVPDAYTGATPAGSFRLQSKLDVMPNRPFRVLMEINQAFDWNHVWHNSLFPEDKEYKTSAKPSLIYAVTVDPSDPETSYFMNLIGHGHYSGANGKLYTNLTGFSTALKIVQTVVVTFGSKR
jgi:hypothetical protein